MIHVHLCRGINLECYQFGGLDCVIDDNFNTVKLRGKVHNINTWNFLVMAPSLSKLKEYQSSLICLSGLSAAAWIIIYGKSTNKKRWVVKQISFLYLLYIKHTRNVSQVPYTRSSLFQNRIAMTKERTNTTSCTSTNRFIFIFEQFKFIIGATIYNERRKKNVFTWTILSNYLVSYTCFNQFVYGMALQKNLRSHFRSFLSIE